MYPFSLHNSHRVIYSQWTRLENIFAGSLPSYTQCNVTEGCGWGAELPKSGKGAVAQPQAGSAWGQEPCSRLAPHCSKQALVGLSIFSLLPGQMLDWSGIL